MRAQRRNTRMPMSKISVTLPRFNSSFSTNLRYYPSLNYSTRLIQNRPDPVESPSQSDSSFMSPAGTQPRSWVEVDEEDPARFPFHKSLALAAKTANGEMAEVAVASMVRAGLVPGPKAWHAVVFSHVRDSRAQGESGLKFAISAASRAFRAGIRLDSQTYLVLIAAHLVSEGRHWDTVEVVHGSCPPYLTVSLPILSTHTPSHRRNTTCCVRPASCTPTWSATRSPPTMPGPS